MDLDSNPYLPPRAPIGRPEELRSFEVASKWRRLGTLLIDYVGVLICLFSLVMIILSVGDNEGIENLKRVPDFILLNIVMSFYYVFFEGLWGRTPGKLICGTRVVDRNGEVPSLGQILGRTFCRFIPFEALSFLGIVVGMTASRKHRL